MSICRALFFTSRGLSASRSNLIIENPIPVHYLKSAIPVAQRGCDGTPSQQFPPELLRASGQDTVLMTDFHARMEFTVWTTGGADAGLTRLKLGWRSKVVRLRILGPPAGKMSLVYFGARASHNGLYKFTKSLAVYLVKPPSPVWRPRWRRWACGKGRKSKDRFEDVLVFFTETSTPFSEIFSTRLRVSRYPVLANESFREILVA